VRRTRARIPRPGSTTLPLLALALIGLASAPAGAQGTLQGTVRVARLPKALPPLPVFKDGPVCGKEVPNEAVVVSPDRELANVVVSLRRPAPAQPAAAPPAPTRDATVDQVGCRYIPHVQAVTVGTRLTLLNSDDVLHNVHAHRTEGQSSLTVFNLAMPFKGQKLPTTLKRSGMMKLRCDVGHTWMSAYVAVFDHPHFAVTDAKGRFSIANLPAGEHTVELWHEPVAAGSPPTVRTVPVRISDGKVTTVEPVIDL
jgi:plastocyanin